MEGEAGTASCPSCPREGEGSQQVELKSTSPPAIKEQRSPETLAWRLRNHSRWFGGNPNARASLGWLPGRPTLCAFQPTHRSGVESAIRARVRAARRRRRAGPSGGSGAVLGARLEPGDAEAATAAAGARAAAGGEGGVSGAAAPRALSAHLRLGWSGYCCRRCEGGRRGGGEEARGGERGRRREAGGARGEGRRAPRVGRREGGARARQGSHQKGSGRSRGGGVGSLPRAPLPSPPSPFAPFPWALPRAARAGGGQARPQPGLRRPGESAEAGRRLRQLPAPPARGTCARPHRRQPRCRGSPTRIRRRSPCLALLSGQITIMPRRP